MDYPSKEYPPWMEPMFQAWGFFCQGVILKENNDKYLYIFLDEKTCYFI